MVRLLPVRLARRDHRQQFFSSVNPTAAFIFALLAFAAGFAVRPFGALVFGRLGDMVGRKYTFLVTIMIMGLSTFVVGLLPGYASIGVAAPIILVAPAPARRAWRSAASTAAPRPTSPSTRRTTSAALYTAWIQTTATLGLFLSLLVILIGRVSCSATTRSPPGAGACRSCCRSSCSVVSVWIRLQLHEIAGLQAHQGRGQDVEGAADRSLRPTGSNWKIVLLALFGLTAGQAVVWYTGPVLRAVLPDGRR